jgi:hypothetical protein
VAGRFVLRDEQQLMIAKSATLKIAFSAHHADAIIV